MQASEHPHDIAELIRKAEADAEELSPTIDEEGETEYYHLDAETEEVPERENEDQDKEQDDETTPLPSEEEQEIERIRQLLSDDDSTRDSSLADIFKKHWPFIIFCIGISILIPQWTGAYDAKVKRVAKLEQKLKDLHIRSLITTAEVIRKQRIGNIEKSIDDLGLNLEASTTPPYEIPLYTTSPKIKE